MDDFNVSALHESKNEWGARLVTILTPLIIDGYKVILEESIKLCKENNEMDKYLKTFQNLLVRVPKWNAQMIETERKRICEKSGCNYLEDLVTCVHIIQLKILTSMRVGQKQKKININVPKLDDFIHKVYINVARKIYKNVYLFEISIEPLQKQKNNRELEILVQEGILNTLRESIPVEAILKAYMDETVEEDVIEEVKEEVVHEPIFAKNDPPVSSSVSFNNIDYVKTTDGIEQINAPKNIDYLEEQNRIRMAEQSNTEGDDHDHVQLHISNQEYNINSSEIENLEDTLPKLMEDEIEFEVLE
jgi:hypothetical protein